MQQKSNSRLVFYVNGAFYYNSITIAVYLIEVIKLYRSKTKVIFLSSMMQVQPVTFNQSE